MQVSLRKITLSSLQSWGRCSAAGVISDMHSQIVLKLSWWGCSASPCLTKFSAPLSPLLCIFCKGHCYREHLLSPPSQHPLESLKTSIMPPHFFSPSLWALLPPLMIPGWQGIQSGVMSNFDVSVSDRFTGLIFPNFSYPAHIITLHTEWKNCLVDTQGRAKVLQVPAEFISLIS